MVRSVRRWSGPGSTAATDQRLKAGASPSRTLLEAVEDDPVGAPDRVERVAVLGDPRLLAAAGGDGVEIALGLDVRLDGLAVDDLGAVGREREAAQVPDRGHVEPVLGDVIDAHALAARDRGEHLRVGREPQRVDRLRAHDEPLGAGLELLQHDGLHRRVAHRHGHERDPGAVRRDRRRAADPEPPRLLPVVLGRVDDGGRRARLLDVDEPGLCRGRPEGAAEQGHENRGRAHAHQNTFGGERLCPAWHVRVIASFRRHAGGADRGPGRLPGRRPVLRAVGRRWTPSSPSSRTTSTGSTRSRSGSRRST